MSADTVKVGRRFAFVILPEWLLREDVSHLAIRVYALIAQHARDGQAWPSRNRLAKLAGCSVRSIVRAVDDLERVGAITRQQRTGEHGEHRSNLYTIHELPALAVHRGGAPVSRGGDTGGTGPRDTGGTQNQTHEEPETRARGKVTPDGWHYDGTRWVEG